MLKICYDTCCGIDVHKKMLVATIATTNEHKVTTYQTKQFSTFTNDIKKLKHFIENSESIEVPWFGQLMMGPQLLAYFYQIYMWGKIYHVELEL